MAKHKGPKPRGGIKNNLVTRTQIKQSIEIQLAEARVVRRMLGFGIEALSRCEGFGKKRGRRYLDTVAEVAKEWKAMAEADGYEYADSVLERRVIQIVECDY